MTDKNSSYWNIRSSGSDDESDKNSSSYKKRSSNPFYTNDDYKDDDYDDDYEDEYEDDDDLDDEDKEDASKGGSRGAYGSSSRPYGSSGSSYGSSRYGSGSTDSAGSSTGGSSSGSPYGSSRYGSTGSSTPSSGGASRYGSGTYGSSRYGTPPAGGDKNRKDSGQDKAGSSAPKKTDKPGSLFNRFGGKKKTDSVPARQDEKKSGGGLGSKLGGGIGSLRQKLPGGTSGGAGKGDKPDTGYLGSKASSTRTLSRFSSGPGGDRHSQESKRPAEKKEKGKSRFSISLPFGRGGEKKSDTRRQPSPPKGIQRAKALPKSSKQPRIKNEGLSLDLKLDLAGWGMIVLAGIIFFGAISSTQGNLSRTLLNLIYQVVGIGWFAVPLALAGIGVWLVWRHFGDSVPELDYVKLVGWGITYLCALTTFHFIHLLTTPVYTLDQLAALVNETAQAGHAGGWLGGQFYLFLMRNLGDAGTFIALIGWWGVGILIATDLSIAGIIAFFGRIRRSIITRYKILQANHAASAARKLARVPTVESLPDSGTTAILDEPVPGQKALPAAETMPIAQSARMQPLIRHRGKEMDEEPVMASAGPSQMAAEPLAASTGAPTVEPARPIVYTRDEPAPLRSGPITLKPGPNPMRLRRPQYEDYAADDESEEDDAVIVLANEAELAPDNGDGYADDDDESIVEPAAYNRTAARSPLGATTRESEQKMAANPETTAPVRELAAQPRPADPLAQPPDSGKKGDDDQPDATEDFMRPAQPRTSEPMRLRTFRTPGAGLSPAERAALMGNFAPGAENEEEAEEPEGDETLADEPVYENLDDIADAGPDNDEELPTVELDEPQIMDEAEPYSDEADDTSGKPAGWMSARSAPVPATPRPTPTLARPVYTPPPEPEPVDEEPEPTLAPLASAPEWVVPNFRQVLDPVTEQNINDDVLLDRARIIEDTLISFGAPGKVVEVNPGPVITQFGIEPDYVESRGGKRTRVKVQAIARLADDLALSLAARSIRIEAPVPGKGFVGIEVPNAETSLVSLRDIMESPEFARLDTKLRIGLGQSVDGTPVVADLTAMPHLLIAGTTGSGKSVCVNAIIACLLLQNTPDDLRMIMVDPKRVELTGYNGIPHLVAPVVVELERIVGVLKWVTREMDDRYKRFNERGARNILTYNNMLLPGEKPLPYLIVIVDELADLMMLAPDETERVLTRLAQMSRATGIHLIISTQRPSVDVVTGLIKANFPARVAFAVASSVDSRVILDQPGAERLLGRGDMLFQAPDAAAPVRLQGVYVSDSELTRLVSHWKGIRPLDENPHPTSRLESNMVGSSPTASRSVGPVRSRTEKYGLPTARSSASSSFWERVTPGKEERTRTSSDDVDELYDESVAVVRRMKKASVSLLQRQLRIGYTRAARLIDVMEERGVVGPAQSGSKPRKVIGYSDDDIDLGADEEEDTMDDIRDDEFSDDFEEDEEIFDDDAYEDEDEGFADDE